MRLTPILLLAPALLLASGCGPRPVRLSLPPPELATCADEPQAPELPAQDWAAALDTVMAVQRQRDTMMLGYTLAMRGAWGDCRAKVDGLKAWRERAGR
jgi:hypothetical protein